MEQVLNFKNNSDKAGNPAGGSVTGNGLEIKWQNGPLGRGAERKDPNGAFVEDVINAAINRLEFFEKSKFKCRENFMAIRLLNESLGWLKARTKSRVSDGIEGTHIVTGEKLR